MGRRPRFREPQIEPLPQPATILAWMQEVRILMSHMSTVDAAGAAFDVAGWRASAAAIETTRHYSADNADRFRRMWSGPASPPVVMDWLSMYLAVQVQLGRLPAAQAVEVMAAIVQQHGGEAVPVPLDNPYADDESGYQSRYRGRR